jgi:hypothetical protein
MKWRLTPVCLLVTVALAGCGKADLVRVARPARPHFVCWLAGPLRKRPDGSFGWAKGCFHRFDENRLLGLTVTAAEQLAHANGYTLRVLGEFNTLDLQFRRLDVEASSSSGSGIVTKIAQQG